MTKTLDGTAVYAYTTLISCLICVPWALLAEGSTLIEGAKAAIAKVGAQRFYVDLFAVGMLYHLYNQVRRQQGRGRGRQEDVGRPWTPDRAPTGHWRFLKNGRKLE